MALWAVMAMMKSDHVPKRIGFIDLNNTMQKGIKLESVEILPIFKRWDRKNR
jgi:hypothetical protein